MEIRARGPYYVLMHLLTLAGQSPVPQAASQQNHLDPRLQVLTQDPRIYLLGLVTS